ncbi:hypothetical protein BKA80DRAFT_259010 [Phyllosticta citrichinensis]
MGMGSAKLGSSTLPCLPCGVPFAATMGTAPHTLPRSSISNRMAWVFYRAPLALLPPVEGENSLPILLASRGPPRLAYIPTLAGSGVSLSCSYLPLLVPLLISLDRWLAGSSPPCPSLEVGKCLNGGAMRARYWVPALSPTLHLESLAFHPALPRAFMHARNEQSASQSVSQFSSQVS